MAGADLNITQGRLEWLHHLARLRSSYREATTAYAAPLVTPTIGLGTAGVGTALPTAIPGALINAPLDANGAETLTPFRYIGGYGLAYGLAGVDVTQIRPRLLTGSLIGLPPYSVVFGFGGDTQFGIKMKATTGLSARLWIDGQLATAITPGSGVAYIGEGEFSVAGTAGSLYELKVSGLDPLHHSYRLDLVGSFWFGGIFCVPGAMLWKPKKPAIRAVLLSDSTGAGAGGPGTDGSTGVSTWWNRVCNLLGWEPYNASIGGTGIVEAGAAVNFAGRVPLDVTAVNPDVIVVSGSRNDSVDPAGTVQAAASSLYAQIKSANPNALLLAVGPWTGITRQPAHLANDAAVLAAALAQHVPYVDMLTGQVYDSNGVVLVAGKEWISGTGQSNAQVGAARHYYNSFDTGQASGAAITVANSGGGSASVGQYSLNDPFSVVAGNPTYDSAHPRAGALGMKTDPTIISVVRYTMSDTTVGMRAYFYFPSVLTTTTKIMQGDGDVTVNLHRLNINANTMKLNVNIGGGASITGLVAIATGQLVRIEALLTVNGAAPTITAKLFNSADSAVADDTVTQSGGQADAKIISALLGSGTVTSSAIYLDDIEVNNVGYPGALGSAVYTKPGIADTNISADGVHPTLVGHSYWSRQASSAFRSIIDQLNAEAFS